MHESTIHISNSALHYCNMNFTLNVACDVKSSRQKKIKKHLHSNGNVSVYIQILVVIDSAPECG